MVVRVERRTGRAIDLDRRGEGAGWKRSFEFDVTDFVKPGERNVVAVCGRNDYGKGGLWKPVALYLR